MTYLIELSYNLSKNTNLNETINKLLEKAAMCRLENFYKNYEFMGKNRKIIRNHCVLTFIFEEHMELVSEFIRFVKKLKLINIESVSYDNTVFKIIYASKKYLNFMEKEFALKYIKDRRNGDLFQQDSILMKAILSKC
jgi:hypothetical protein|tara:strand:+ start:1336 stop:1749 length:414 start_codon:yes stop_codon:yes gene_type:complete